MIHTWERYPEVPDQYLHKLSNVIAGSLMHGPRDMLRYPEAGGMQGAASATAKLRPCIKAAGYAAGTDGHPPWNLQGVVEHS